jgi:hypothetical protein
MLKPGRAMALAAVVGAAISCGGGGGSASRDGAVDSVADASGVPANDAADLLDGAIADSGSDSAPAGGCMNAADCAGLPAGTALPHCGDGQWSCLRTTGGPGRCVRECMSPARTCSGAANNCIVCTAAASGPSCPDTACEVPPGNYTLEGTSCGASPAFDREDCRGGFVFHASGLCSVQMLATGALRFALACPGCTSIFMVQ